MASAVNGVYSYASGSGSDNSSTKTSDTSGAATKEMFLQLLVAQIKNQDPLNPADSVQFVSQLAQFSELEQVIAIRGDADTLAATVDSSSSDSSTGTSGTDSSTGTDSSSGTASNSGTSGSGSTSNS